MQIFSKAQKDYLVIYLVGELDHHASDFARSKLDALLDRSIQDKIIVDVSGLEFMDSTGIGVLLGRFNKMKAVKKSMFISGARGNVDKVFNMSGIYKIMPKIAG